MLERPGADNSDANYDQIAEKLADPDYPAPGIADRFGIEVLATTDDPADDLAAHEASPRTRRADHGSIPTFRPDRYLEAGRPGWLDAVKRLGAAANIDIGEYDGYVARAGGRRRYFIAQGATSADHSHLDAATEPLDPAEAPNGSTHWPCAAGSTPPRRPRSVGTWCWRWPGCPARTAW